MRMEGGRAVGREGGYRREEETPYLVYHKMSR